MNLQRKLILLYLEAKIYFDADSGSFVIAAS